MLSITLNPGFVCILAALAVLGAPRSVRAPIMALAALVALWLMLDRDFGAAAAAAQMGLPVVLLNLDALNRIFGIAMLIALIILAMGAGARRSRAEDAAILLLAGGAVSALFVGDLVSFVAAAALAGLAGAWLVFASPLPNAARSGVRLLIWHGIEGLLFLFGVAFQLSAGAESSVFTRLDAHTIGGGALFAALLIRVGAPFAHVWPKDAVAHASPVGAGALTAFSTMLGVYALARLFPAEALLMPMGMAMIVIGACFAIAEDDLRRAAASGLTAHVGVSLMLIGAGSPLALAAAEGHAFTAIFAFLAYQITVGCIVGKHGHARISQFEGLSRTMPITALLLIGAGLAVSAAPGLALYVTSVIGQEASAQGGLQAAWVLLSALSPALLIALMLRPAMAVFRGAGKMQRVQEAPFPMLLAAGLAVFFCLSVGLAPDWLYGLLPYALAFQPYAVDRLAPHLELLGGAGASYIMLRALKLAPTEQPLRLLDVDSFYRGPAAGAGRWLGVVLLRMYGAWQSGLEQLGERLGRQFVRRTRDFDRPYNPILAGSGPLVLLAIAIVTAVLWRQN